MQAYPPLQCSLTPRRLNPGFRVSSTAARTVREALHHAPSLAGGLYRSRPLLVGLFRLASIR
jgi:hypothetical protein